MVRCTYIDIYIDTYIRILYDTLNTREEQIQDFDELASKAANSKPRVLIPKLSLPNEILRSEESENQDANMGEFINSNEN